MLINASRIIIRSLNKTGSIGEFSRSVRSNVSDEIVNSDHLQVMNSYIHTKIWLLQLPLKKEDLNAYILTIQCIQITLTMALIPYIDPTDIW